MLNFRLAAAVACSAVGLFSGHSGRQQLSTACCISPHPDSCASCCFQERPQTEDCRIRLKNKSYSGFFWNQPIPKSPCPALDPSFCLHQSTPMMCFSPAQQGCQIDKLIMARKKLCHIIKLPSWLKADYFSVLLL